MPRRVPNSAKHRKADLQLKRAIKRGDVVLQEQDKPHKSRRRPRRVPTGNLIGNDAQSAQKTIDAARRLQSSFTKVSPEFLAEAKDLASTLPLPRPIPLTNAIFTTDVGVHNELEEQLTCPKRPKWRYDMTKKEVESNEEGLFAKWLSQTDALVEQWRTLREDKRNEENRRSDDSAAVSPQSMEMPPSPTYFERNLEVWRQLWRVTELSQIILVLLDSRCPPLHFPLSLSKYLEHYSFDKSSDAAKKIVLVLTKVDISGSVRADAWETYLRDRYPDVEVIQVESYYVKPEEDCSGGQPQRSGQKHQAHLPQGVLQRLVGVLSQVHNELCHPPERVRDDPEKLAKWRPPVRRTIDWDAALQGTKYGQDDLKKHHGLPEPDFRPSMDSDLGEDAPEPECLTIGLIGQPNVGKSSLINALFGESKVRASKTPGKTKHFQTLFLTPEIRFVDCPGLVMPSYIPMEMQVLCGILPISRISSIPSCIYYASTLLPLEQILRLAHPAPVDPEKEYKRTWREGMHPRSTTNQRELKWAAMDILTAYANYRGWITAKSGWPDVMRAGNALLRLLSEGRIHWTFLPPLPGVTSASFGIPDGDGIWIRGTENHGERNANEPGSDYSLASSDDGGDEYRHEIAKVNSELDSEDALSDAESQDDVREGLSSRFQVLGLGDDSGGDEDAEAGETMESS